MQVYAPEVVTMEVEYVTLATLQNMFCGDQAMINRVVQNAAYIFDLSTGERLYKMMKVTKREVSN